MNVFWQNRRLMEEVRNLDKKAEAHEELANAIILLAVKDWRTAAKTLKRKPDNAWAWQIKRECVRFFRSKWFGRLTRLDGNILLEQLEKEATQ